MSNDDEHDDPDRIKIREEVANMSFEDLQKLKEKLGAHVYNEAIFGTAPKRKKLNKTELKRENKNRPREISSKKPVPLISNPLSTAETESSARDPRFDSLCGTYNPKAFRRSFNFLSSVRQKELKKLKEELRETEDEERKSKIKYLIQRLENQNREYAKQQKLDNEKHKDYEEKAKLIKEGKTPLFMKKSEKKMMNLVEQFEDLKKTGKIGKHITKHRKKNMQKARKHVNFD